MREDLGFEDELDEAMGTAVRAGVGEVDLWSRVQRRRQRAVLGELFGGFAIGVAVLAFLSLMPLPPAGVAVAPPPIAQANAPTSEDKLQVLAWLAKGDATAPIPERPLPLAQAAPPK